MTDDSGEGAELDEIVLEESSGAEEGSADLELDQFQATEIREIFLTTLPEYLEPVRQMVGQLFAADGGQSEMRDALETTLGSIHTAALRVGIDDVAGVVERMRSQIAALGSGSVSADDARAQIELELEAIERIASSIASQPAPAARAETIVAALGRLPAIDKGVLEKLTAAGLVTVDQIRMADPQEIVAVSGLDASVVAEVVRALGESREPESPDEPSEAQALDNELERALRAQAELELGIEQANADLLRLRASVAERRRLIDVARERREAFEASLRDERARVAHQLARLAELERERVRLAREQAAANERIVAARSRAEALTREHTRAGEECERLAEALTVVTTKVGGLVRSARARTER